MAGLKHGDTRPCLGVQIDAVWHLVVMFAAPIQESQIERSCTQQLVYRYVYSMATHRLRPLVLSRAPTVIDCLSASVVLAPATTTQLQYACLLLT